MKRKFLSTLLLFAMVLSIAVADMPFTTGFLSFMANEVSADEPDPDDERRLRVVIYHNDIPIASSRDVSMGYNYPSFVKEGTLTLRAYNADDEYVPNATIYYTTSEDSTLSNSWTSPAFPNNAANGRPATLFQRHDGGVSPIKRGETGAEDAPAPNCTKTFTGQGTINVPATKVNTEVFTVSAFAMPPSGSTYRPSHPVTRSLVLTANRWEGTDFMVFSIYSDARGLWNHGDMSEQDGILVTGQGRGLWNDEYRRLNPGRNVRFGNYGHDQDDFPPTTPANYFLTGRGAERAAYVEMFDPNTGYRFVGQTAGIRVKGGWSRGTIPIEQRTFEIYGRNDYNEYDRGGENTFLFPLFGEQNVEAMGSMQGNLHHRFRRFRVRNGGSDREQGYIRDELGNELMRQAGMPVPQNYRPAAVFLNGAYYGLTFMKTPRTENAWMRLYGGETDRFHHISSRENATAGCYNPGCGRVIDLNIPRCPHTVYADCDCSSSTHNSNGTRRPDAVIPVSRGCGRSGCPDGVFRFNPAVCNGTTRLCERPSCDAYSQDEKNTMCDDYNTPLNPCTHTRGDDNSGSGNISSSQRQCKGVCDYQEVASLMQGGAAFGLPAVSGYTLRMPLTGDNHPSGATGLNIIGLTDETRWAKFNEVVDVDQWLRYYAMQLYAANVDWPDNNMEFWRYFPSDCSQVVRKDCNSNPALRADCEDTRKNIQTDDLRCEYHIKDDCEKGIRSCEVHDETVHPYLRDGKWRIIAQDIELGYNLWGVGDGATNNEHMKTRVTCNNINMVLKRLPQGSTLAVGGHFGSMGNTFVFPALMQREDMKTRIANCFSDLLDGACNPTNALSVQQRLRASYEFEHLIAAMGNYDPQSGEAGARLPGDTGSGSQSLYRRVSETGRSNDSLTAGNNPDSYPWPDHKALADDMTGLRSFLQNRPTHLKGHINTTLGRNIDTPNVTVNLTVQGNGHVTMNSRPVGMLNPTTNPGTRKPTDPDPRTGGRTLAADGLSVTNATATGKYLTSNNTTIPFVAQPWPGYKVQWPSSGFSPDPMDPTNPNRRVYTGSGTQSVTISFVKDDEWLNQNPFDISTVNSTSFDSRASDWIEIHNRSDKTLSTRGLYIADAGTNNFIKRFMCQLPSIIIPAGEKAYLPTDNNKQIGVQDGAGPKFLKRAKTNFNIGLAERIRLTRADGTEITMVDVTYLLDREVISRQADGNFRITVPNCYTCGKTYETCTCPCPGNGYPCGETIPQCKCCKVCRTGPKAPYPCSCPPCTKTDPPCGGTITFCWCSKFVLKSSTSNTPVATGEVSPTQYKINDISVVANGTEGQSTRWRVTVEIENSVEIPNWRLTSNILPSGATITHNAGTQSPANQIVVNGLPAADHGRMTPLTISSGVVWIGGQLAGSDNRRDLQPGTHTIRFSFTLPTSVGEITFKDHFARPCDHSWGEWVSNLANCAAQTRECANCSATENRTDNTLHVRNLTTNCRQCTVSTCTAPLMRACPTSNPCAYCITNPSCSGCGADIPHPPCPDCLNPNCACTCGPQVTNASSGINISAITVTILDIANDPVYGYGNSFELSGLNGLVGGTADQWIEVTFPFAITGVAQHNGTFTRVNDYTWRITFPDWAGNDSLTKFSFRSA